MLSIQFYSRKLILGGTTLRCPAGVRFDPPEQTTDDVLEQDLLSIALGTTDRLDTILRAEHIAGATHRLVQQQNLEIGQRSFCPALCLITWLNASGSRGTISGQKQPPAF